jgi:Skp family chaperone for outer membrane proteins
MGESMSDIGSTSDANRNLTQVRQQFEKQKKDLQKQYQEEVSQLKESYDEKIAQERESGEAAISHIKKENYQKQRETENSIAEQEKASER